MELNEATKLQLSRTVLDLSDISIRGINISNSLNAPFTKKNDRLLGYPSRVNSNNAAFEETQPYTLTSQNNIVSTGEVVITSFDEKKGIKIQLAEGYGFWSTIGKKRLNDLDLFEFDEEFGNAAFNSLQSKTSSPWLWALADNLGNPNETALDNLQYSRPSYRFRILIDQIVSQAGYSIDLSNLLEVTNYDDIGCLGNTRDFAVTDYKTRWEGSLMSAGIIDVSTGNVEFSENGNVAVVGDSFENQLYKTSYAIKGYVDAVIDSVISISYTLNSETTTELVTVPKGRSFLNFRTDEIEIESITTFSTSENILFEDVRIYSHILESDIVDIEGDWKGNGQNSILNGYQMLTDYNTPNITQSVLFKSVIKMLFLKVDVDELTKTVFIKPFSDILDTNNAIDLSGKAKRFPSVKSGKSFGQLNLLTYTNDDSIGEDLGQATFFIDNKNAVPSKKFISISQFSASRQTIVDDNTTVDVKIYSRLPATRESTKDRVVEFITGDGIDYTATFSGVSFQNLYSVNYIRFIESVKRERILPVKMLLSFRDFRRINDTPIIFLKEFNSYFLVLKISGFEEGEFCKVKMVKYL